jgi:hypothetical protein
VLVSHSSLMKSCRMMRAFNCCSDSLTFLKIDLELFSAPRTVEIDVSVSDTLLCVFDLQAGEPIGQALREKVVVNFRHCSVQVS